MTEDARFEDAIFSDQPLRLIIESVDDLQVTSALLQDAVGIAAEIIWMQRRHRLVIQLNRFRWEDSDAAAKAGRRFERVRSTLIFNDVLAVRADGLDPKASDMVYSVLQLRFSPGDDGTGTVIVDLAGDGALEIDVEVLDARLVDLTRPWVANARMAPKHDLE